MGRFGSGRFGAVRWFGRGSGEGSGSGSGNKVLGSGQGSGKVSGKKVCGRRKAAGKVAGRGGFLEGKVADKVPEDFGKGLKRRGVTCGFMFWSPVPLSAVLKRSFISQGRKELPTLLYLRCTCAGTMPAYASGFQFFAYVPAYADLRISGFCLRARSYDRLPSYHMAHVCFGMP